MIPLAVARHHNEAAWAAVFNREPHPDPADVLHYYCCDPDRGMCGAALDCVADAEGGDDLPVCRQCQALHDVGASCGARLCALRSWIRDRRRKC